MLITMSHFSKLIMQLVLMQFLLGTLQKLAIC